MKTNFIYALLILASIASCEESELEVAEARVVVEAYLHANEPISILVSKEILFKREADDTNFTIGGLDITMEDGEESFELTDEGDGVYTNPELVDPNKTYSLSFIYEGNNISSETSVPSKPAEFESSTTSLEVTPFAGGGPPSGDSESLDLNWDNDDLSYYIVVVTNLESNPSSINTTGFQRPSFRSEPLVTDNYEVRSLDFQYYGDHSVILYKVNPDYAALYEDPGDNSLTIKTPFSNVKNGLGIFTAINSDTLYINVHN